MRKLYTVAFAILLTLLTVISTQAHEGAYYNSTSYDGLIVPAYPHVASQLSLKMQGELLPIGTYMYFVAPEGVNTPTGQQQVATGRGNKPNRTKQNRKNLSL